LLLAGRLLSALGARGNVESFKAKLDALITDGVAITVFQAEEALRLEELVGREAPRINAAGFGALFGSLQVILGRYIILTTAQLFEKPNQRYQIRSVPAAIKFLYDHADALVVEQRPALLRSLSQLGAPVKDFQEGPDPEVTRFVAQFFEEQVSRVDLDEASGEARALTALKTLRDKVVAHSEAVQLEDLPKPTYAEIDRVVALARSFVGAVAFGYLSVGYDDNSGSPSLSFDAQRATTSLRRLLERSGVLPSERSGA
jgi:hypothetical protein